jgi:hypothetical protein
MTANEPVAFAVVFLADSGNPERERERAILFKDHARADKYVGDPLKPHDEPMRVRPLVFGDDDDA